MVSEMGEDKTTSTEPCEGQLHVPNSSHTTQGEVMTWESTIL